MELFIKKGVALQMLKEFLAIAADFSWHFVLVRQP